MGDYEIRGNQPSKKLERLDSQTLKAQNLRVTQDQNLSEPLLKMNPDLRNKLDILLPGSQILPYVEIDPSKLREALGIAFPPVTQKEHDKAVEELNSKVSSIGISYKEATEKMKQIEEQYTDDKYFDEWYKKDESDSVLYDKELLMNTDDSEMLQIGFAKPKYIKHRKFNPEKLPEPARTEYLEAKASKREIEMNNVELHNKTRARIKEEGYDDKKDLASLLKEPELTPKQKAAREKLNELTSSKGLKYADAKTKIEELKKKYIFDNNPEVWDFVSDPTPKFPDRGSTILPNYGHQEFNPEKIPNAADKKAYFEALDAILEIEKKNYALLTQAGLKETEDPRKIDIYDNSILYNAITNLE